MPRANRKFKDCHQAIKAAVKDQTLTSAQMNSLLSRTQNMAEKRAKRANINLKKAIEEIAGEVVGEEKLGKAVDKRNKLLTIRAKRAFKDFVRQFSSLGKGVQAFLEGTGLDISKGQLSVDAQSNALFHTQYGRMLAAMEKDEVALEFAKGKIDKEIWIELGEHE